MGTPNADSEIDVLTSGECFQMLAARGIGRIGLIAGGYPLIIPVNYALDRDVVVIRTQPGSIVARAEHANVTFQVDEFNAANESGWSVLLRGQAESLTAQHSKPLVERTLGTDVRPWAPGDRNHWMRIIAHGISGRRIVPGEDLQWRLGSAAYM